MRYIAAYPTSVCSCSTLASLASLASSSIDPTPDVCMRLAGLRRGLLLLCGRSNCYKGAHVMA
jgi:hypothetical protein